MPHDVEQNTAPDEVAASDVVLDRLRRQVAAIVWLDPQVRLDRPDAVHQTRVAMRRLRSALATFRALLDARVTDPLREELAWVAGVLGQARDAEVMHERLTAMVASEPDPQAHAEVMHRIDQDLDTAYREAHARSVEVMDSERYRRLLDALERLVTDPPWTDLAARPARSLPRRVRHDWRRMKALADAADEVPPGPERELRLHEVRKAAKRLRYAAETLEPVYGAEARALAEATERVQTVLGDRHDSVVSQQRLRRLADQAERSGESSFTYGRLHAREADALAATDSAYAQALREASPKRLRRWLR